MTLKDVFFMAYHMNFLFFEILSFMRLSPHFFALITNNVTSTTSYVSLDNVNLSYTDCHTLKITNLDQPPTPPSLDASSS